MSKIIDTSDFESLLSQREAKQHVTEHDKQVEILNNSIDESIKNESDEIRLKMLNQIRNMPSLFSDDLELKKWFYNNGNLRTLAEIQQHNKRVEDEKYYRTTWNKDCSYQHKSWFILIASFLMIPLGLLISCKTRNFGFLIFSVFATFGLLLFDIIYIAFKSHTVRKNAQIHNIPHYDSKLQQANIDKACLIAGSLNAAKDLKKHTTKSFKELSNPNSWNRNY